MSSLRSRRRNDGSVAHSVLWRDQFGKQTSMTFPDHQSAENFRRILDANRGDIKATRAVMDAIAKKTPTVAVVGDQHIDGLVSVSARTRVDYKRLMRKHIAPTFGSKPIDQVTVQNVRDWVNDLSDSEMADKSISHLHGLLSAIMKTAVERGYRTDNPSRGMRLPRRRAHEKVEMTFLTPQEWAAIDEQLAKLHGGHYQLHFRTLAGTGMRWGELGGLTVADLSLDGKPPLVRINKALKRDPIGAMYVGPTKTRRSIRSISIAVDLAKQLDTAVSGRKLADSVFTSVTGRPIDQHYMRTDVWHPAVKASGVGKRPRIHDLRHSHASWLIAAGVDLLTVQRRLGHESITTTADTYSHLLPGQQQSAADAIAAAMR